MRESLVGLCSGLLAAFALSCAGQNAGSEPRPAGPPLSASQALSTDATVRLVALEGGCWALQTAQGSYEPIDLPAAFRSDGLPVYVVIRGAPHAVSLCMIAPLVTIDTIRAR